MKRENLMMIAALCAPALVAIIMPRIGVGGAPSSARAFDGTSAPDAPLPVIAMKRPSAAQLSALARIQELRSTGGGAVDSPFLEPSEATESPVEVQSREPSIEERLAGLVDLSTVFGGSRGAGAMINGKLFRAGDRVIEGVTIESIDVASRSVIVASGDERYRLTMPERRGEATVVTRVE